MEFDMESLRKKIMNIGMDLECYIEQCITTRVRIRSKYIEDVSHSIVNGGQIRIKNGSKRDYITFNSIDNIDKHLEAAIRNFSTVASLTNIHNENNIVYVQKDLSYQNSSLEDIVRKLTDCNNEMLDMDSVQNSVVTYGESYKKTSFINSDGTIIEQQKQDSIAYFSPILMQKYTMAYPVSIGASNNVCFLDDLENSVLEPIRELLTTRKFYNLKSGYYPAILDPMLCGTMIHEVLGHLLEADSFYEQPKLLEYFKLNKRIAATSLTVEDRPDIERLRGSYKFDDEGTPAKGTCLVQSGILKSFLNSKETAKKFNQRETGNARLLNYKFKPIVRMSNIVVHKGDSTFEQMIEDISYGVYLKGLKSANTNLTSFTIIPRECLLIEHGKVTGRVYNVAFVGTIDVLKNIRSIGDTLHINQGYSCNKYSQRGLPVGILAPYMHIDNCYIEEIR